MLTFLFPVLGCIAAGLLAWAINWLGLIRWRRSRGAHWTERARLAWPTRVSALQLLFFVPAVLTGALWILRPGTPQTALVATALGGLLGASLGSWPLAHELDPELKLRAWLHELAATWILRLVPLIILFGGAFLMPPTPSREMAAITLVVVLAQVWMLRGGPLRIAKALGILVEAPPRLHAIVSDVAAKMTLPMPRLWMLTGSSANALALPLQKTLVFTERAVAVGSDEELGAICAHEFGHLGESAGILFVRCLSASVFVPWIFFTPVLHAWPGGGVLVGALLTLGLARIFASFRRRMENRADALAARHQGPAPEIYASALERFYEVNLVPAVIGRANATHPDLYDRLLAVGVTPGYPRPLPPPRRFWAALGFFAVVIGLVSLGFFNRSLQSRHRHREHPQAAEAAWR